MYLALFTTLPFRVSFASLSKQPFFRAFLLKVGSGVVARYSPEADPGKTSEAFGKLKSSAHLRTWQELTQQTCQTWEFRLRFTSTRFLGTGGRSGRRPTCLHPLETFGTSNGNGSLKKPVPKNGLRKHGPKPAVCTSCLILSHTQMMGQI